MVIKRLLILFVVLKSIKFIYRNSSVNNIKKNSKSYQINKMRSDTLRIVMVYEYDFDCGCGFDFRQILSVLLSLTNLFCEFDEPNETGLKPVLNDIKE